MSFWLFCTGVTGKMTTETAHDDDNFGTESSQKVNKILPLFHVLDAKLLAYIQY